MLSYTYSPQNVYCFAIDAKSEQSFKQRMQSLAECMPNVILAQQVSLVPGKKKACHLVEISPESSVAAYSLVPNIFSSSVTNVCIDSDVFIQLVGLQLELRPFWVHEGNTGTLWKQMDLHFVGAGNRYLLLHIPLASHSDIFPHILTSFLKGRTSYVAPSGSISYVIWELWKSRNSTKFYVPTYACISDHKYVYETVFGLISITQGEFIVSCNFMLRRLSLPVRSQPVRENWAEPCACHSEKFGRIQHGSWPKLRRNLRNPDESKSRKWPKMRPFKLQRTATEQTLLQGTQPPHIFASI